jgi:hypothetical protein
MYCRHCHQYRDVIVKWSAASNKKWQLRAMCAWCGRWIKFIKQDSSVNAPPKPTEPPVPFTNPTMLLFDKNET